MRLAGFLSQGSTSTTTTTSPLCGICSPNSNTLRSPGLSGHFLGQVVGHHALELKALPGAVVGEWSLSRCFGGWKKIERA